MAVIIAWISLFESTLSIRFFSTLMILPRSGSTACVLRSRPCLAEPPAESPSTMKISASAGSRTEQSASLPGSVVFSSADLRRVRSRALRAASRAREACDGLADDVAPVRGVLLQELGQPAVDRRLDEALDRRVAELGLGLALELRVLDLDRDDRRQSLAHVLAAEVVVLLLELALLARVVVDRARQRRAEAREVRAALDRVDVVGEREQVLLVGGVPLQRDLDLADLGLLGEEHDLLVQRLAGALAVQVLDEVDDAALVLEVRLEASPRSSAKSIFRPLVRKAISRKRCSSVSRS